MWSSNLLISALARKLQPSRTFFLATSHPSSRAGLRSYSLSRRWLTKSVISNPSRSKSGRAKRLDGETVTSGGWFLLVIPVTSLGLGIWQLWRWRWKLGLIEEMRQKSIADPVPLPHDVTELEQLEYQQVILRGAFDYTQEVLIGPRSLVPLENSSETGGRGVFSSSSQNTGYLIITPFKLDGTNESILVNRGWIGSRNHQKFKHVTEPVELTAIVRKTEPRAPFMNKNKPGQTLFHYRDVPSMARILGTKEVFVDLFSIDGVDFSKAREESIPVPRQTRVTLRNEHVSYFITWFSLSAITSLMWHRRFIKGLNLL